MIIFTYIYSYFKINIQKLKIDKYLCRKNLIYFKYISYSNYKNENKIKLDGKIEGEKKG